MSGVVQEKGADYRFKKEASDPSAPKEWEFKIQLIDQLNEIKSKFLKSIILSVSLPMLSEDFVEKLTHMVLTNKGNTNLYVEVLDDNSSDKITLFARQHRFNMNKDMYKLLKDGRDSGVILDIDVKS